MTSYYSQIQYVPNALTGERINFGVVAVDSQGCRFHFVRDWRRAAAFGGEDVGFLREFADDALSKGSSWFSLGTDNSPALIAEVLRHWHNKIQFTELRPSTKARDELLADVSALFLKGEVDSPDAVKLTGRGREKAVPPASEIERLTIERNMLLPALGALVAKLRAHGFADTYWYESELIAACAVLAKVRP
jgi:hypothetical protein